MSIRSEWGMQSRRRPVRRGRTSPAGIVGNRRAPQTRPRIPTAMVVASILSLLSHAPGAHAEQQRLLFPIGEMCETGLRAGFVDRNGRVAIRPGYNSAGRFHEGLALVEGVYRPIADPLECEAFLEPPGGASSGSFIYKYRHIDLQGRPLYSRTYGRAHDFHNGMAIVAKDGEDVQGFVDRTGREVIPRQFAYVRDFSDGLAAVMVTVKEDVEGVLDDSGQTQLRKPFHFAARMPGGLFAENWKADGFFRFHDASGSVGFSLRAQQVHAFSDGLAAFAIGRERDSEHWKWGFVDTTGKAVVPPTYDFVGAFSEGVAPVRRGQTWSLVEKAGAVIRSGLTYTFIENQHRGLFLVLQSYVQDGRRYALHGAIDRSGRIRIPLQYSALHQESDGLLIAAQGTPGKNMLYGAIDAQGRQRIPFRFNQLLPFREGRSRLYRRERNTSLYGFIDTTGNIVLAPVRADFDFFYSDGMARAKFHDPKKPWIEWYDFYDRGGKPLGRRFYTARAFSGGLAAVQEVKGGNCGYINPKGEYAIPPELRACHPFHGRLAPAMIKGGGTVLIDRTGKIVVGAEHKYVRIEAMPQLPGLFTAVIPNQSLYGYVNAKGTMVLPPIYDGASDFADGVAAVGRGGESYFIDKRGRKVGEIPGFMLSGFSEGLAVIDNSTTRLLGYANLSGIVIPARFTSASPFSGGRAAVCEGRGPELRCAHIDKTGRYLYPLRSGPAGPDDFRDGLAIYQPRQRRCGFVNESGRTVIPAVYSDCLPFADGIASVGRPIEGLGILWQLIDRKGHVVWQQTTRLLDWFSRTPVARDYPGARFAALQASFAAERIDLGLLEEAIFQETNRLRRIHGRAPFGHSAALGRAARGHSQDMVRLNFFSHESPVPGRKTTRDRLRAVGITRGYRAENIAFTQLRGHGPFDRHTYLGLARTALLQWMRSAGHRKNILRPTLKTLGVGTAYSARDAKVLFTQNFAQ